MGLYYLHKLLDLKKSLSSKTIDLGNSTSTNSY